MTQGFYRSFPALLFRQAQVPGTEHDIRQDCLLKQLVFRILKYQTYFGPELLFIKAFPVDIFAIVIYMTGRRHQQAVEHLYQGRLAGPGMSDQTDEAVIGNLGADPLQSRYLHGCPGFICICNIL